MRKYCSKKKWDDAKTKMIYKGNVFKVSAREQINIYKYRAGYVNIKTKLLGLAGLTEAYRNH